MWKIIVERSRPQMTIWRMRIACWIRRHRCTLRLCNTYCFPLQQWLHERSSVLRYKQIACNFSPPLSLPRFVPNAEYSFKQTRKFWGIKGITSYSMLSARSSSLFFLHNRVFKSWSTLNWQNRKKRETRRFETNMQLRKINFFPPNFAVWRWPKFMFSAILPHPVTSWQSAKGFCLVSSFTNRSLVAALVSAPHTCGMINYIDCL
jgi:hypothetical protein